VESFGPPLENGREILAASREGHLAATVPQPLYDGHFVQIVIRVVLFIAP